MIKNRKFSLQRIEIIQGLYFFIESMEGLLPLPHSPSAPCASILDSPHFCGYNGLLTSQIFTPCQIDSPTLTFIVFKENNNFNLINVVNNATYFLL